MKITEEKSPDSDIMANTQIIYLYILLYLLTQILKEFLFWDLVDVSFCPPS